MSSKLTRSDAIFHIKELAQSLGAIANGTDWHLFGSVNRDEPNASDIDLMILCQSDSQADTLRCKIDTGSLPLPLHLSLLTFDEASAVNAILVQQSCLVLKIASDEY
ncbi:MAG: hypothetical protein HWD86_01730 [Kangiellaceae bacterium]|nr:hypothetical protein [Kangiellaceae bacterium]